MRLAWLTDVHLDFVDERGARAFYAAVAASAPDAVLVGGDTAVASSFERHLRALAAAVGKPVWFVLGNHDYYGGSIEAVRRAAGRLTQPPVAWLQACGAVRLTEKTSLVGHDGWGDARLGNWKSTPVVLNDFNHIRELRQAFGGKARAAMDTTGLVKKLRVLGDEAATHFAKVAPEAMAASEHVLVLTHVPPFREATWHQGAISNDDFLPYFTCAAAGVALRKAMEARPDRRMTVLCGHTHGGGEADILPNLHVTTGGAAYGQPAHRVIEVP